MSFAVHSRTTITACALLVLSLLASGCSWWRPVYQSPEVELTGIELKQARLDRQRFVVHLRVDNRSSLYLPLYRLDYRLFVNDQLLGEGQARPDILMAPHSQRELALQLDTRLWQRLQDVLQLVRKRREPIPWRLDAEIDTGWLIGPSIEVHRSGLYDPRSRLQERLERHGAAHAAEPASSIPENQ